MPRARAVRGVVRERDQPAGRAAARPVREGRFEERRVVRVLEVTPAEQPRLARRVYAHELNAGAVMEPVKQPRPDGGAARRLLAVEPRVEEEIVEQLLAVVSRPP